MGESALHGRGPVWQGIDDDPGGEIEGETVESGIALEEGYLPGPERGSYSEMV